MRKNLYLLNFVMLFTMTILILHGCTMKEETTKASNDMTALDKIVILNIQAASVKWEIFGTPEHVGGVPGPTDYITLIAELRSFNDNALASLPAAGKIWIAPESPRSWLDPGFFKLLDSLKNQTVDFSKYPACREAHGTLRQTGARISGFACANAQTILIYLTIADNSRS